MRSLALHRATAAWLIITGLAGTLLSACDTTPQPAPAATIAAAALPADWQQIALAHASLAVPPEWATTAADSLDVSDSLTAMAAQNPDLQAVLDQGRTALASGEIEFIAYDLQPERVGDTGFPINLRIGRQTYSSPPDPQQVATINEQQLRATAGFRDVQQTPVAIGSAPATRLTSKLEIKDAVGEPLVLAIEQYLVVIEADVYVLTFTTPDAQHTAYRATFDQILATMRFDPPQ